MTTNMNRKTILQQQRSLDTCLEESTSRKSLRWRRGSFNNGKQSKNKENSAGTLTRGREQLSQSYSNSLVDYSDPQRTTVVLEKQDNEAFGFEVQTYGIQLNNSNELEMCTFVCSVKEGSSAETAGLTAGDIILTVNGVIIKGFTHHKIIELIRESVNMLKMETVSGSVVKRIELEKKMRMLKQTLHDKWLELQALTLQEKRLTRGNLNDNSEHPSIDSLMSLSSPTSRSGRRFSSDSSWPSVLTDEIGEDVFDEPSPCSPHKPNCDLFSGMFQSEGAPLRQGLCRTRSISSGSSSNSCQSPTWDNSRMSTSSASSVFGTLPRRGRKGSMRKNLLKLLPGLKYSLEEEETT
ncbi:hypothetical protein PGIGA_G00218900 [Pangasianodon gigas]|uniref:Uncharacterized protein n=1 Tax=Pangasianodon gigas TaxID=30993 RepID=A0ACC5WI27_PANGG|nr:hypothetical protein [Pangasianodon gigas]